MTILMTIFAIVLAAAFGSAGLGKLIGVAPLEEARGHLGLSPGLWRAVGALEVLGAAGVLIGLAGSFVTVGVLAGAGLVAMTIGATYYHRHAGDGIGEWLPAVVMGSVAIFYVITRIGTA